MCYLIFLLYSIALLDFPSCVIGEQPELTAETLEIGDTSPFCWRNMFSCINLLRVLNKLTKWKQSRIMVSNQPHSPRSLSPIFSLYILNLDAFSDSTKLWSTTQCLKITRKVSFYKRSKLFCQCS